jgi:hypothetical protein
MKTEQRRNGKIGPECDFSSMQGGMRGKYYEQYRKGSNVVLLDPDIAKAFPSEDAVNEALRSILPRRARPPYSRAFWSRQANIGQRTLDL